MGGDIRDFSDLSMYDYQLKIEAHKQIFGISDEHQIQSSDDLDELYSRIKPEHLH